MSVESLITQHIDIWTSAVQTKSTAGRGTSSKLDLYGIKKLRELILELAVRGKLVPQDQNDEPASVLQERIEKEKTQLIKNGKIKKSQKLEDISNEDTPFDIPSNWAWQHFIDVLDFSGGGQPPKSYFSEVKLEGYVQLIQIRDLGPNPQPVYVPKEKVTKYCTPNDVMVGRYGASVGKVFWGKDGAYNVALIKIHNDFSVYIPEFIYLLLSSPLGQSYFSGVSRSAQDGFSKNDIAPKLVPILSHSEQHRIVGKVDELMKLCDQLEQQTEASIAAHQVLVETLLATLTNSADAEELMENWQRISAHFDTLFTTEESIDQLKQTILQLAVMGKLVPQNPADEPASELLKRIAKEKAQLVTKKEIPKPKKYDEISCEDRVFSTPKNWVWVRLDTLFNVIVDCPHSTAKFQDNGLLCIDTNSFKQGQLHKNKFRYVSKETFDKRNARLVPQSRDIIFAREGSVGESVVIPEGVECCLGQRVMLFRPSEYLNSEFLRLTISNKGALSQLLALHKGIGAKHVNVSDMRAFSICLPPENEQNRIVGKINELMKICEQLISCINESQTTQLQLTDVFVEKAI